MDTAQTTQPLTRRQFRIRRQQIWDALRDSVMPQLIAFIEEQADAAHSRHWSLTTRQDPKKPQTLTITVHPRD